MCEIQNAEEYLSFSSYFSWHFQCIILSGQKLIWCRIQLIVRKREKESSSLRSDTRSSKSPCYLRNESNREKKALQTKRAMDDVQYSKTETLIGQRERKGEREREESENKIEKLDQDASLSLRTLQMFTCDENCPPSAKLQRYSTRRELPLETSVEDSSLFHRVNESIDTCFTRIRQRPWSDDTLVSSF